LSDEQGCRISVPAGLLTAFSEQMVSAQLQTKLDKGTADFDEVTSWPHASSFPGLMTTTFKIDVPVPFCLNDVEVTVTSTTTFALSGDMLQTVSEIDHSADFWDTASCGSQTGPKDFGSIAAEIFAGFYEPDVSGQLGNLPGCAWTVANEEITCNYPISLPFGGVAASISQLTPTFEGLQLDGVVVVTETKAPMSIINEHPKLAWTTPGLCEDFVPHAAIILVTVYPGLICDYTGKDVPVILATDGPATKAAKQEEA